MQEDKFLAALLVLVGSNAKFGLGLDKHMAEVTSFLISLSVYIN